MIELRELHCSLANSIIQKRRKLSAIAQWNLVTISANMVHSNAATLDAMNIYRLREGCCMQGIGIEAIGPI